MKGSLRSVGLPLEVILVEEREDLGWWRRSPRNPLR